MVYAVSPVSVRVVSMNHPKDSFVSSDFAIASLTTSDNRSGLQSQKSSPHFSDQMHHGFGGQGFSQPRCCPADMARIVLMMALLRHDPFGLVDDFTTL